MPSSSPMRGVQPSDVSCPTSISLRGVPSGLLVSKVMAPLYATEGTIADGSPIAAEVERIMP